MTHPTTLTHEIIDAIGHKRRVKQEHADRLGRIWTALKGLRAGDHVELGCPRCPFRVPLMMGDQIHPAVGKPIPRHGPSGKPDCPGTGEDAVVAIEIEIRDAAFKEAS